MIIASMLFSTSISFQGLDVGLNVKDCCTPVLQASNGDDQKRSGFKICLLKCCMDKFKRRPFS